MKAPIRIAITGAAGQIAYALLFRIAHGDMLGKDQPVILQLLDLPAAQTALSGVAMELDDCDFPLLDHVIITDQPEVAFQDAQIAMLIGSRPRGKGMERKDLIEVNGAIFSMQGQVLNKVAARDVKVLVVGNPANTNALIAMHNAPDLDPRNFSSMMRLDHNRAIAQVAHKLFQPVRDVKKMVIWGNHSSVQYPDLHHAKIRGRAVDDLIHDPDWVLREFIPNVQKRGTAVIEARGLSSAASAANAAIGHVRDWVLGTHPHDWTSMGVLSDGSYGIAAGVMYGFPVTCKDGQYEIVQGLPVDEVAMRYMQAGYQELVEEREHVLHLLG